MFNVVNNHVKSFMCLIFNVQLRNKTLLLSIFLQIMVSELIIIRNIFAFYIPIYICDWILETRPNCHTRPIPFYWPS